MVKTTRPIRTLTQWKQGQNKCTLDKPGTCEQTPATMAKYALNNLKQDEDMK